MSVDTIEFLSRTFPCASKYVAAFEESLRVSGNWITGSESTVTRNPYDHDPRFTSYDCCLSSVAPTADT